MKPHIFAMIKREFIFQSIFGSDENDGKLLLEVGTKQLSKFVYDVACEEPNNYTDSATTGKETIEATMENFDRLIALFENAVKSQKLFLQTFEECSPLFKKLIDQLREVSKCDENIKFRSKVILIISGIVGTLSAIALSLSGPSGPAPVAKTNLTAAGMVMMGASVTEVFLRERKLQEAQTLILQIERGLKNMAQWFEYPQELKKAFETLINYKTLTEINDDIKKFFSETFDQAKLTAAEFKKQFKEKLEVYMKKMMEDNKISELDKEIRPIIKTFIVICLVKGQNQFVLDSINITLQSAFGAVGLAKSGKFIFELLENNEVISGEVIAKIPQLFVPIMGIISLFTTVLSAGELIQTSELSQKINEAVNQFEMSFSLLENVYKRIKNFEVISESEVIQWTAVIVNSVPDDTQRVHITRAVKLYLHKDAHGCIKLEKLPTGGNNWLVSVPESHSRLLLEQNYLEINNQRCKLIK